MPPPEPSAYILRMQKACKTLDCVNLLYFRTLSAYSSFALYAKRWAFIVDNYKRCTERKQGGFYQTVIDWEIARGFEKA